ncbi:MAG TPA: hypothetical protein VEG33_15075 [Streptosporangiaceae bacterium]|nr:hypothetical protein [Streptosporangiaceae bacterium]
MVADTAVQGGIRGLFEGLVPGEVIDAYDRLLASNGCAKEQAEALVGDAGLVATLTEWGMAHFQPHSPADPAWLRPASPDLALQGVLGGCRVSWWAIRSGSPAARNCCWLATVGWPMPRRDTAWA